MSEAVIVASGKRVRLSVLDQSPVPEGSTPAQAIKNSIELAKHVERLGYHRYWMSEHHAMDLLACTAPEVLLARIGAETSRIRIGSGGIMLPHYSAYKVAEVFRTLHALYPGRVDLGIGRAPGGGPLEAHALRRERRQRPADDFRGSDSGAAVVSKSRFSGGASVLAVDGVAPHARRPRSVAAGFEFMERGGSGAVRIALCIRAFFQPGAHAGGD